MEKNKKMKIINNSVNTNIIVCHLKWFYRFIHRDIVHIHIIQVQNLLSQTFGVKVCFKIQNFTDVRR